MVDILDVARFLIFLSYGKHRYSLTPLKLHKLLYLVQGWSYVWDNTPAFVDDFCAWKYGPVNEKVYEIFKRYGRTEIPEEEGCSSLEDKSVEETTEAIWSEYGKFTAYDLVELTHSQEPWKEAYSKGSKITKDSIKVFFQSTY